MIDTQTTDQPVITTIPRDAKPSEMVRSMDDSLCCRGCERLEEPNGTIRHCGRGWLMTLAGYEWGTHSALDMDGSKVWSVKPSKAAAFLSSYWDIPLVRACQLAKTFDTYGKDAAADFLEWRGL